MSFLFHNQYVQVVENNVYASVLLSDFFNYKSYFSFILRFGIDRALINAFYEALNSNLLAIDILRFQWPLQLIKINKSR